MYTCTNSTYVSNEINVHVQSVQVSNEVHVHVNKCTHVQLVHVINEMVRE